MYTLSLRRYIQKKVDKKKIKAQIEYLISRGVASNRGRTWSTSYRFKGPSFDTDKFVVDCQVKFIKTKGRPSSDIEIKQWEEIKSVIQQCGKGVKFGSNPWIVKEIGSKLPDYLPMPIDTEKDCQTLMSNSKADVKTWNDLIVPNELLGAESDFHLSNHDAWKSLYGVNPQIRIILSNIKRAHDTNGESRNHAVLFGHAGCGKTTTMFALEKMFGSSSVLKLDATSTTKAGIEKLFFSELENVPPLVFMEEAEKADPDALKIWLGALDDRGEIRKVNFRVNQLRQIKVLFICTVNNKTMFDKMMGSDGSQAGALSSRCVTQVYYPRPSDSILYQILDKEIEEKGGNKEWIEPAIKMADALKVTDPRIVKSYLAGGDRLLDGTYQRDWYEIQQAAERFNT